MQLNRFAVVNKCKLLAQHRPYLDTMHRFGRVVQLYHHSPRHLPLPHSSPSPPHHHLHHRSFQRWSMRSMNSWNYRYSNHDSTWRTKVFHQKHDRIFHHSTQIYVPFAYLSQPQRQQQPQQQQQVQWKSFWSQSTTTTDTTTGNNPSTSDEQMDHSKLILSKYEMVDLEEYIYTHVTKVLCDPVLQTPTLSSLQWLQKRIGISYSYDQNSDSTSSSTMIVAATEDSAKDKNDTTPPNVTTTTTTITLQLQLRLPSLLHPKLKELKSMIQESTMKHAQQWLMEHKQVQVHHHYHPSEHHQETTTTTTTTTPMNTVPATTSSSSVRLQVDIVTIVQPPVPIMSRFMDDTTELLHNLGPGLASVAHVIAVYSCKGGVGKSTVAVNLAYEMATQQRGRIGLLDLDLYGPSLPVLIHPTDCTIRRSPLGTGLVYPITYEQVKLLSLGFVNTHSGVPGSGSNNGASIMKGPMAVKVVSQLLKGTDWGALDVLILDLPPGTGDVQLAVLQQLQLSGAIAVSTPSKLATTDTRKGIEMFTSLGVPTLAVVENMSYFDDDTGQRHYPFGKGFMEHPAEQKNVVSDVPVKVVQLPISIVTNDANDSGIPLTLSRPKEARKELLAYQLLSNIVSEELLRLQYGVSSNDETAELVTFDAASDGETYTFDVANITLHLDKSNEKFMVRIFSETNAVQLTIPSPSDLRARDPRTGDVMTDSPYLPKVDHSNHVDNSNPVVVVKMTKRSPSIIPVKVERRGRYGFAVEWADGATIIYSMRCLAKAAGGKLTK